MIDDPDTDPELAAAATAAVASVGTDADFDDYLSRFRTAPTPQLKLRYMYSLAEFPTQEQIHRTIDLALSNEVKTQDAPFLLNRCIANRAHGPSAWETVRQQWPELLERFPNNTIVRMVGSITTLTTPHLVADVQGFFSEHPIPQAAKTLEQLLERQRVNAELRSRESEPLAAALAAQG
jgi:puromycin-sensitive aminopeptidase